MKSGRHLLRGPFLLAGLVLLLQGVGFSKDTQDEWPPISREELSLKDDPTNPGAPAVILYREVNTDDPKSFQSECYRIKVLNDEGKKYADIQIIYSQKLAEVDEIRGRTVRPDGTVVRFEGQIFDRVVMKAKKLKFQAKALTLPDVQKGSIIEYSYKLRFRRKMPDVLRNPQHYIITSAESIPTAHWVVQDELFTRRARFILRPMPGGRLIWTWMGLAKGTEPRRQPDGTVQLEVENLPAFQKEEYMPPEGALKSRADFFYILGFLGSPESYWRELGTREARNLEKFLSDPKKLKREVSEIVSPDDVPETKLRKLYARVQQIRYLSYEPAKTEKEEKGENLKDNKNVEEVLKHGYAYANEINLVLVALARAAGFDSAPIMVVARSRGFFERNVLDPFQLDAMVVWARAGSKDYYLDPATRYCPFNMLPWEETASTGIVLGDGRGPTTSFGNGEQPSLLDSNSDRGAKTEAGLFLTTPNPSSSEAVIERKASLRLDGDGDVEGSVTVKFVRQEALERRIDAREMDETARRKALEDEVKSWLPPGATVELTGAVNWEQSEEPLHADVKVKVPSYGASTGRRLLLSLALFQTGSSHPFQGTSRVHPVYFHYPHEEVDDVTWQLPAGYRVENQPPAQDVPSAFGRYALVVENQAGALHLKRRLAIWALYVPANQYSAMRTFFRTARSSDENQLVLETTENARNRN